MAYYSSLINKKIQTQFTPKIAVKKKSLVQLSGPKKYLASEFSNTPIIDARSTLGRIWRARNVRCFRHSAKFALIYCVLSSSPRSRNIFWRKFTLKTTAKTRSHKVKQLRMLRLNRYRRTVRYAYSYRKIVLRRRGITFHNKFSVLRRIRQLHNFRVKRSRKLLFRYKKNLAHSRKRKTKVKRIKRLKRVPSTKLLTSKRATHHRRNGRFKLRRWERRKNRLAVLAAISRVRSLLFRRNRSLIYRHTHSAHRLSILGETYSRKVRQRFISYSRKLFISAARTLRNRLSEFGYRRRQLRRNTRYQKNRRQLAGGVIRYYIRHQYQSRSSLTFRARWRRWSSYVRSVRVVYPPRKCRKKSLRLHRRALRKRKLFVYDFLRPHIPTFYNSRTRLVLKQLLLHRRAKTYHVRAAFRRRAALACKTTSQPHYFVQAAILRSVVSTQVQFFRDRDLRANLLRIPTSFPLLRSTYNPLKKKLLVRVTSPQHLSRSLLGVALRSPWRRSVCVAAALHARKIKLQYFAKLAANAKTTSQRAVRVANKGTRVRQLLKRRMWQKISHKCTQSKKFYWKKLVRSVRRRILARRIRASFYCYSTTKSLLPRSKAFRTQHLNKNKNLSRAVMSKHTFNSSRKFGAEKRWQVSCRNTVRNLRFQTLRRVARKLGRKVSRKFGRRFKRIRRRRRSKFHSSADRRRHSWDIARRFKFKRAPHLIAQLATRAFAQNEILPRLRRTHPCIRISLRSTKLHTRKLFDRYKFATTFRPIFLFRQREFCHKVLFTNFATVRHSKKPAQRQTPTRIAAQAVVTTNRVPLHLQLFAAQLLATDALGASFVSPVCSIGSTTRIN